MSIPLVHFVQHYLGGPLRSITTMLFRGMCMDIPVEYGVCFWAQYPFCCNIHNTHHCCSLPHPTLHCFYYNIEKNTTKKLCKNYNTYTCMYVNYSISTLLATSTIKLMSFPQPTPVIACCKYYTMQAVIGLLY